GLRALRVGVAERVRARYNLPTDESWVVVTAGASVALGAVIGATTDPGDEVLCPDPGYPAFGQLIRLLGRRLKLYPSGGADPARDVRTPCRSQRGSSSGTLRRTRSAGSRHQRRSTVSRHSFVTMDSRCSPTRCTRIRLRGRAREPDARGRARGPVRLQLLEVVRARR